MKIVHVIGRYNKGGTASWLNELLPALRNLGHTVELYAGNVPASELEDPKFGSLGGLRFEMNARSISPIQDFIAILKFRKILKSQAPDILNTHTTKAGMIGRLAAIGLPIKICHTYHGHLLYGYFSPLKTRIYRLIEKFLALLTDKIIVVGEKVGQELLANGIGNKEKFHTIYPGIGDLDFTTPEIARQKYGIENQVVVGWLGRVTHIKRPDILLDIASQLPNVIFLVGGTGELSHEMQTRATSNVRWLGWVNPEEFWPACNLAILTSDNEGLPTSLVEAGFAGIPIIAHDVGSVSEIFIDGKGGFMVLRFNDYLESIKNFSENQINTDSFSIAVKEFVEERFSKEKFIVHHEMTYKE